MEPGNDGSERPRTLGQTWRIQRSGPPQPAAGELPQLPDWPPLPEEKPTDQWPSLGSWSPPSVSGRDAMASVATDGPAPGSRAGGRGRFPRALRRLRAMPRRATLALGLGAVVLLIAALSVALAARVPSSINSRGGIPPLGSQASQTASGATSTELATVTPQGSTTPAATQPPALSIAFTCASGQLHSSGKVCVHTQPGASLRITVRYCNGAEAKGLHGNATANADGDYTWTWPIGSACVGTATANVTAKWQGQTATSSETFAVSA